MDSGDPTNKEISFDETTGAYHVFDVSVFPRKDGPGHWLVPYDNPEASMILAPFGYAQFVAGLSWWKQIMAEHTGRMFASPIVLIMLVLAGEISHETFMTLVGSYDSAEVAFPVKLLDGSTAEVICTPHESQFTWFEAEQETDS